LTAVGQDGPRTNAPPAIPLLEVRRPARRRTELGLIVLAVALTGGLYALASAGRVGTLPPNIVPFLGVIFALLLVGHIAMRKLAPEADPILLPVAGLLNGVGYVFIARLSSSEASAQALWSAIGMAAFIVTLLVVRRARDLARYRYTWGALGFVLLLLPLVPGLGENIYGARLWIHIGSHEFQPGELAELALAIFFAAALVERADQLSHGTRRIGRMLVVDPKYLAPVVLAWGLSLLIFLAENDLGSSFLFFALFLGMLWIATSRTAYLLLGGGLFGGGAAFALTAVHHAQTRVQSWLHPFAHPNTSGYQILQGLFAIANGGLFGTGPGQSNAAVIPEASSDMIFAVIAEEIGLAGVTAILAGYLILVGTGLRIALRCEDPFEKLLAAGLSLIIGIQTFVIVGGVTRLIPLTGITLPFVAYGGSSLISFYILLALLLRISDTTARKELTARVAASERLAYPSRTLPGVSE
jgi:cell division protein FtsW (lipid II flippase)